MVMASTVVVGIVADSMATRDSVVMNFTAATASMAELRSAAVVVASMVEVKPAVVAASTVVEVMEAVTGNRSFFA
jgi:hypothetical protein